MPLVPKMIRELVFALPPLGEARVLDLLCRKSDFFILNVFSSILAGSGACSVAVKKAYPRCRLTILDKSQFRLEQCRRQLEAVDTNFTVESEYNTEVCQCFKSVGFLLSTFSWTFLVKNFQVDLSMWLWPPLPSTLWPVTRLRRRGLWRRNTLRCSSQSATVSSRAGCWYMATMLGPGASTNRSGLWRRWKYKYYKH